MEYVINYTKEGKILGFVKGDTDLNIGVDNQTWFNNMGMNKIIIDGENISFDKIDWRTAEKIATELILIYKGYYLEVFNTKLKTLDYDSIATVNMWALKENSQFQAECKSLLNWYEAIILKNYEILNAVKAGTREIPTKEEYLSELPSYTTYEL